MVEPALGGVSLDEPCVGVDVGAKVEIYRVIGRLVQEGAAVLVLSSDLPELLGISDWIVERHRGEIAAEFRAGEVDSDQLLACATGASRASAGRRGRSNMLEVATPGLSQRVWRAVLRRGSMGVFLAILLGSPWLRRTFCRWATWLTCSASRRSSVCWLSG
jgi:energy-coupling factor transporter ATP-binding protein EcfA2